MHVKAKQRIAEKKQAKDTRPNLKLPAKGNAFDNLIGAIDRLCDNTIHDQTLTADERRKIAFIKSRIKTI